VNIIKPLEERIVNLTKSANGVRTTEEAELRQLDVTRGSRLPRQIVVVLAKAFGVQLTMNWDTDEQKFTTELDNIVWSSDFDYNDYLPHTWATDMVVRSPRRGRQGSSAEKARII
jgi:hypothetical protein